MRLRIGFVAMVLGAASVSVAPVGAAEALDAANTAGPAVVNFALHRQATGSVICKPGEEAEKAVNGLLASKTHDKFCSLVRPAWLRIDLQAERTLHGFTMKHAQAGDEPASMNTRAFALSVSRDGMNWRQVVKVDDNVEGVSVHRIAPVRARYVRLDVGQPAQDPADPATRIYELEAW